MSSYQMVIELGDKLADLVRDQSQWSQETFGPDTERGPLGPLKHLAKEAVEAQQAVGQESFREEMADCLILVLDANRRGGVKVMHGRRKLSRKVWRLALPLIRQKTPC